MAIGAAVSAMAAQNIGANKWDRIGQIARWGLILNVVLTGAVVAPLVILAVAMLPVRLGFAYVLQPRLGAEAIWWSFPLGSAASLIMATICYLRGTWRAARIETPVHHVEVRHTSGVPSELSGAGLCAPT